MSKWTAAATPMWALVSGMPEIKRRRRVLLMLQVFVDESFSEGIPEDEKIFAMGGVIATEEAWAVFSDEWQEALSMRNPKLESFKMSEAMSLSGPFRGMDKERRNERVRLFNNILSKHMAGAITFSLPLEAYRQAFSWALPGDLFRSPYYVSLANVMVGVRDNISRINLEGPIDFVFDNTIVEKAKVMEAWEKLSLETHIGEPPIFRNDHLVMPLQGADMMAWIARENAEMRLNNIPREKIHFKESANYDDPVIMNLSLSKETVLQMGEATKNSASMRP